MEKVLDINLSVDKYLMLALCLSLICLSTGCPLCYNSNCLQAIATCLHPFLALRLDCTENAVDTTAAYSENCCPHKQM